LQVPEGAPDAFLFAGIAIIVACVLHFRSLSAVTVLVIGAVAESVVFSFNLGRLGNAFSIWLGISPPELFFFAFLPPLLLECALAIDWYTFKKNTLRIVSMAFFVGENAAHFAPLFPSLFL
jgi:NhaP-type Na+/H+ or K+/H+ antiporter